jgi:hypothetical protein
VVSAVTPVRAGERPIVKVCYGVEDARAAAARWASQIGAGPFFVKDHIPMKASPDGLVFDHTSAFGRWGDVMVELMQFHEVLPPAASEVLVTTGLHHVTWFADSLEVESSRLQALGWPVVLRATTAGGVTFSIHDARNDLGHLVEIYERSPGVVANYARVLAASVGWNGTDPVRES